MVNPFGYLICITEWFAFNYGSKRVIAPSLRTAQELYKYYGVPASKIEVLPHGVDVSLFSPPIEFHKKQLKADFMIDPDAFVLLTVTNEVRRKGCFLVLGALKEILLKGRAVHYVIVGRDDYSTLQHYARSLGLENYVSFLPPRSSHQLVEIFNLSDAFVFPTYYESFGLVGLEAMACGLPLIATRVGGVEDYLVDEKNGLFIDRTINDLKDKILHLLDFPEHVELMSKLAREQAQNYTWNKVLGQLENLIKKDLSLTD